MKYVTRFGLTFAVALPLAAVLLAGSATGSHARDLIVSAAASLTDGFKDIEPAFEAAHPGVDVVMNFASSGALYRQIEQGAPADVYASANPKWMNKAVDKGFVGKGAVKVFARNALVLAVPADNPAKIGAVADLSGGPVKSIAIGTPETVPAGQYAKGALEMLGMYGPLGPKFVFCENVRQVLDYLVRGEVDAGFVYATDAAKGGDKVGVVAELELKKPVTYPIAPLVGTDKPSLAAEFVAFVISEKGQKLLITRGFKRPE